MRIILHADVMSHADQVSCLVFRWHEPVCHAYNNLRLCLPLLPSLAVWSVRLVTPQPGTLQ